MQNEQSLESSPPSRQFPPGTKLLVVDDVSDIRVVLNFFLRRRGAEVLTAENATDAIQLALSEKPDLILMDMQLPDMDGYSATRRLRQGGFTAPIIAMTGRTQKAEKDRCLLAGCDDYLSKPIDLGRLQGMIEQRLFGLMDPAS